MKDMDIKVVEPSPIARPRSQILFNLHVNVDETS